jgi:hypothetical protein
MDITAIEVKKIHIEDKSRYPGNAGFQQFLLKLDIRFAHALREVKGADL